MTHQIVLWLGFTLFILAMLALDLGVFHRRSHTIRLKEALGWSAVWITLALLFNMAIYWWQGPAMAMTFLTGYLFYDTTHYAIHHFNMKSKFWLAIKNHHMKHHYQDADKGFGVSQPTWDYVFGTTFSEKKDN